MLFLFLNLLENRRGIYCICSGYMHLLFLLDFNLIMLVQHLLTVTPVVGLLLDKSKFEPIANPSEVESIFDVPLEMFLKDEAHRYEDLSWRNVVFRVHFFDFESPAGVKYSIWGLTASVLIRAASIILQCEPAFIEAAPCLEDFSIKEGDL
jgi:hypothetical protein